jgi:hypothetical protein
MKIIKLKSIIEAHGDMRPNINRQWLSVIMNYAGLEQPSDIFEKYHHPLNVAEVYEIVDDWLDFLQILNCCNDFYFWVKNRFMAYCAGQVSDLIQREYDLLIDPNNLLDRLANIEQYHELDRYKQIDCYFVHIKDECEKFIKNFKYGVSYAHQQIIKAYDCIADDSLPCHHEYALLSLLFAHPASGNMPMCAISAAVASGIMRDEVIAKQKDYLFKLLNI